MVVRPRSIRGRITALVTLVAVLLLLPMGLAEAELGHQALTDAIWLEDRQQAVLTAAAFRVGRLTHPIVPTVAGIDLVQVVAPNHLVLAASKAAGGRPPLASVRPAPGDPERDVQTCVLNRCVRLTALRVSPAVESPVVYAGRTVAGLTSSGALSKIFGFQNATLTVLAALAAWTITGRTLKPVEAIRARLAVINGHNLSGRVPEPYGQDEIARLARTVNGTLSRIEDAKRHTDRVIAQQRQFVADASHELRTPLAGLRAELEEGHLHPEQTELPTLIERALVDVDRLESIVCDLLLLARIHAGAGKTRVPIDVSELIRTELARRSDPLPVRTCLEPGVVVSAVRGQLVRVLANLMDNAQQHGRTHVLVELRSAGDYAELVVADDGAGIPAQDRERVFDRFVRLDAARSRDRGGTGLGLAIAREIANAHDGTLEAGETCRGGARLVVRLPIAEDVIRSQVS
ncbi:HAMP domain-containing histidine kinase [Microbispora sp. RL4-1S]|uniref:histidine kinase n=1 Tax=Microbispora oryzae TaxID=2806554 RepID=A0A940WV95_9ACTN|nr:HAMP domain-containing sensor histidine kinase [Microbispora oryzae]MBP2707841.1 HAMP domain-containing histidine kinase [Microbispora oryzae]